jgi:NAD(P)-dependent dehydrogenase (short-subunit alcohol dehydrogenase family)
VSESCVVVGIGPGLGAAIARRFHRGGFPVGLIARRAETLQELADELGDRTAAAPADAGDPRALESAIEAVTAELGEPAILVYNAAIFAGDGADELDADEFNARFRTNVGGAFAAAKVVREPMRRAGRGTILFTGGRLATHPMPSYAALSVGKAGIRSLALVLHEAWAPDGIHVGTVTIHGMIGSDEHHAPDAIAESFWTLHAQPPGEWDAELVYE